MHLLTRHDRVRLLEQELQSLRGVVNDLAQCRPPGYGRSLAISNNIVGTTPLYQPGTKEPNPHRSVNATLPPPWPKPVRRQHPPMGLAYVSRANLLPYLRVRMRKIHARHYVG